MNMKDKENKTDNIDITTSTNKDKVVTKKNTQIKFGKNKKILLVIAIVALVLVSLAVVYLFFSNNSDNKSALESAAKDPVVTTDNISNLALTTTSENKADNIAILENGAKNEKDPVKKSKYLLELSNIYINSGENDKCIEYGIKADTANPSLANAGTIAECARRKKDFKLAAEWYGKAAERSPKVDNPNQNSPYNDYIRLQKEALAKI